MSSYLRSHAWKSFRRSPLFGRNMAEGGLKLFFGLYFAVMIFGLSAGSGFLLKEFFPKLDVIHTGGAIILYYFICGLIMRFVFQQFKGLHIQPYLHLPIKEAKISNYLLNRSFFDFFNLFPLLLVLPFMLVWVLPNIDKLTFFGLLLFFIGITFINHFVAYLISKGQSKASRWLLVLIPLLVLLIYLDYEFSIGIMSTLSSSIEILLANPWFMPLPAIVASLLYFKVRTDINHQLKDIQVNNDTDIYGSTLNLPFLEKHGIVGSIIQLEANLMLRSKRARQYAYSSILMLLYPLFIFGGSIQEDSGFAILAAAFVAGAFSLNYGTLLFSWNSNHFDLILSKLHDIEDYIKAKYYILSGSTVLFTLIGLPYLFLSVKFYMVVLAVGLFGLSVIPMIYIVFSLYNSKKIDPNQGGAFSTSGMGAMHFVIMLPVIAVPALIYYLGNGLIGDPWGAILIAATGLICLLLMKPFIRWAVKEFHSRKHILNEAFREQ